MILGKKVFVTPSDSLAVIADCAEECIPYFKQNKFTGGRIPWLQCCNAL